MGRNGHRKLGGEDREGRKLATYLVLLYICSHSEPCSTPCPHQAQTPDRVAPEMSPKTSMQHRQASVLLQLPWQWLGPSLIWTPGLPDLPDMRPTELERPLELLRPALLRPGLLSSWRCLRAWCLDRPVLLPPLGPSLYQQS